MRGIERMLGLRRERLFAGEQPLGWKTGFGSAAARETLGTSAPLVGFMTDASIVEPGAEVSLDGWANPVLEPELAVYVDGQGGVVNVGLAFELVDLDPPPDDAEQIMGRNIYHRSVVLGPERAPSYEGLRARVYKDGAEIAATDDVGALNGDPAAAARHVAETVGTQLRPGDVVIAGSIVPAIEVKPGDRIRYELDPIGSLEVSFSASASSVSS
jgi:2-keto-4-pentenoate hydratase